MTHRITTTLLSQEKYFAPLQRRDPPLPVRQAHTSLGAILCNGHTPRLVSSLHMWTDILSTTSIHLPHAQLSDDEETTFLCPAKG